MLQRKKDITLVLGGGAGQGIQTIETLLLSVLRREGYFVSANKEYMSRIRGGSNSTQIRIASSKKMAPTQAIDIFLPLNEASLDHIESRLQSHSFVLADTRHFTKKHEGVHLIDVPFASMATEFGNPLFANTIAVGVVLGLLHIEMGALTEILQRVFAKKGEEVVRRNIQAGDAGQKLGKHLAFLRGMEMQLTRTESVAKELLMSGSDALGMGVVAARCNFIASYPMSPGTALLSFLAQHAKDFHIAVEQVEDEIAAINMALGASYAGAKAIVTTSGGGFALMEEGVSLAGMIETPLVIHIAQRPGPATGLPTRTEQADFNLALYAGHGEFPRAIFAPGDFAEAFEVAQVAFRVADASQSPVFLLTDQYVLDMVGTLEEDALQRLPWQSTVIKTTEAYQRYALSATGISPRGVPHFGEGLVVVDSDEHTEDGHLTERFEVRKQMMEKRMCKELLLQKEVLAPVMSGSLKGKIAIVGWGSTKAVIAEAVSIVLGQHPKGKLATIHFKQVYPLPENLETLFAGAKKIIVVENNFTGQFANLLRQKGIKITTTILKYNGEPFFVEELTKKITECV